MRLLSLRTVMLCAAGVILSAALLSTFGCSDTGAGPGLSEPPTTTGSNESFVDKRPKEIQEGKTPKAGRKPAGATSVKGNAPAGAQ
jgi:hypothetical protein